MELQREFFPSVRKTIMPRPHVEQQTDVLGTLGKNSLCSSIGNLVNC